MTQPSYLNIQSEPMAYAGFWWRFLALFIDVLILQVVFCPIGLGLGIVLGVFAHVGGVDYKLFEPMVQGISFVMNCVVCWLYFACFEASKHQATPGKLVCKLQVVDYEGERLCFGRASIRYWATFLSGLPCMAGYIMAAFTAKKQTLHDMIASTLVIQKNS